MRTLRPPELFGELGLLDGAPRSARAKAAGATSVLVVTRSAWEGLLADPVVIHSVLAWLAGRLRATTQQLAEHALVDLTGRVDAAPPRPADPARS